MIRAVAFLCALVVSEPAFALSCLRPDVARSYQAAASSADQYVILLGTFAMDRKALQPKQLRDPNKAKSVTVSAQFSGKFLSREGFVKDWAGSVQVTSECFGSWCAGAPAAGQMLAFVEKTDDGYALKLSPCGGFAFANPSPAMLDVVKSCHSGGPCVPDIALR
ncbi:hypothetical protein [Nereida sp. MMG025]|uniref:hypothetical protein n=1 Tax=Nereida sp. MMG025 TaxID=2909981 RepID=UPI001F27FC3D|nr:hypothetical protein [Nereida sp. MMG025]MCF6444739.1 hypothetical protein [Nereida sp. MMG025]